MYWLCSVFPACVFAARCAPVKGRLLVCCVLCCRWMWSFAHVPYSFWFSLVTCTHRVNPFCCCCWCCTCCSCCLLQGSVVQRLQRFAMDTHLKQVVLRMITEDMRQRGKAPSFSAALQVHQLQRRNVWDGNAVHVCLFSRKHSVVMFLSSCTQRDLCCVCPGGTMPWFADSCTLANTAAGLSWLEMVVCSLWLLPMSVRLGFVFKLIVAAALLLVQDLFAQYDKDKSGTISFEELAEGPEGAGLRCQRARGGPTLIWVFMAADVMVLG